MPKKTNKRVLVLASGGLDSAVAAYQAKAEGSEVWAINVNYGQDAQIRTLAARILSDEYAVGFKRLTIKNLKEIWTPLFKAVEKPEPFRCNRSTAKYLEPILAIIGAAYGECIGASEVITGYTKDDFGGYGVSTFKMAGDAITTRILTPMANNTKAEVVKLGLDLKVPFDLTWSCFNNSVNARPCGVCDGCKERAAAFKKVKADDPLLGENSKLKLILEGMRRAGRGR